MLYQDIIIPESGYEYIQHSINQIIQAIHVYNSNSPNHLALDFPEHNPEQFNGQSVFGTKIRIFSNEYTYLLDFNKLAILRMLKKAQLIHVMDIADVPDNIRDGRIISRVNLQNKTLNAIPRQIKRMKSHQKDINEDAVKKDLEKKWSKNKISLPFISLTSKSNGHTYSLFLSFQGNVPFKLTSPDGVNSYGLSNSQYQFIIPVF